MITLKNTSAILVDVISEFIDKNQINTDIPIALGCSGGPDSLALAIALKLTGFKSIYGIIVDHKLRKNSTKEAIITADWLKKYEISPVILTWSHKSNIKNSQNTYRNARFALISQFMSSHDLVDLYLAHHLNDQKETIYMRKLKQSKLHGQKGMLDITYRRNYRILRPLLKLQKTQLIEFLQDLKQNYITDESNLSTKYTRNAIRLKHAKKVNTQGQITDRQLSELSKLNQQLIEFTLNNVVIFPTGYAQINTLALLRLPLLMQEAILRKILGIICAKEYDAPTTVALKVLSMLIDKEQRLSIWGIIVSTNKKYTLIFRDFGAITNHTKILSIRTKEGKNIFSPQQYKIMPKDLCRVLWDNRFIVHFYYQKGFYLNHFDKKSWQIYEDKAIFNTNLGFARYSIPILMLKNNILDIAFCSKLPNYINNIVFSPHLRLWE